MKFNEIEEIAMRIKHLEVEIKLKQDYLKDLTKMLNGKIILKNNILFVFGYFLILILLNLLIIIPLPLSFKFRYYSFPVLPTKTKSINGSIF